MKWPSAPTLLHCCVVLVVFTRTVTAIKIGKVPEGLNATDWKVIRIFPPSTEILQKLVTTWKNETQVLVVDSSLPNLSMDIALPSTHTLKTVLASALPQPPHLCFVNYHNSSQIRLLRAHPRKLSKLTKACVGEEEEGEEGDVTSSSLRSSSSRRRRSYSKFLYWTTVEDVSGGVQLDGTETLAWDNFYRYNSIHRFAKDLSRNYNTVEYLDIGKSVEGRRMFALLFASKSSAMKKMYQKRILKIRRLRAKSGQYLTFENLRKKREKTLKRKQIKKYVFIDAGTHAREWIAPAVATYISQQLAKAGKRILRRVTIIIAPAVNPDGYEYSHTTDRYWRKNRRNTTNPLCPGVDLNRNWGMAWGDPAGSSNDPCAMTYHGVSSFSEPETQAVRDLALAWIDRISWYVSLHSSGSIVLYPWSYMDGPSPKEEPLVKMARNMAKYLGRQNQIFAYGQTGKVMYSAAGTSEDYMHAAGVQDSFTLELPEDSFIIHPNKIIPISKAVWKMLVCTLSDTINSKKLRDLCKGGRKKRYMKT